MLTRPPFCHRFHKILSLSFDNDDDDDDDGDEIGCIQEFPIDPAKKSGRVIWLVGKSFAGHSSLINTNCVVHDDDVINSNCFDDDDVVVSAD